MVRARYSIWLAAVLAATLIIYLPGIRGPYVADDLSNLANNRHLLLDPISWQTVKEAAFSSQASPYYRPLSMLSFALGYTAAGDLEPGPAKLINILLHLITGVLAYVLARELLQILRCPGPVNSPAQRPEPVALFVSALWLLHPLFVSTVLYTVQRMSILSALFTIGGCLFYVRRRPAIADMRGCIGLLAGAAAFTVVAFLCKETGALLPGFLLLIEIAVFRSGYGVRTSRAARYLLATTLLAPTVFILLYLLNSALDHWDQLAPGYYFTIHERFLTQFRALMQYAGWLSLLSIEPMGLYHDDFPASSSLADPPTTLLSLLLVATAGSGAAVLAWRRHLIGFGVLWFLWGHALESTVVPLAAVFEHRNYLPGFGLILAMASLLYGFMQYVRASAAARNTALIAVLVLLPGYQTWERVQIWADKGTLIAHLTLRQPDSAMTLISAAAYLNDHGDPGAAMTALREAMRANPLERAPVFAEAAMHCEHWPASPFPPDLRERLTRAGVDGLRTATARLYFVQMAALCATSAVNDDVLMEIYQRHRRSRNENLAVSSLFGLGAVLIRRHELAAARDVWAEAVNNHPHGEVLRPWLDELLKRPDLAPGGAE